MERINFRLVIGLIVFVLGASAMACFTQPNKNISPAQVPPPVQPLATSRASVIPRGWKKVNARDFSFYIPPYLKGPQISQDEGEALLFSSNRMILNIDNGIYPNSLTIYGDQPDYQEEKVQIDDREAKICTFRLSDTFSTSHDKGRKLIAAVHFPELNGGLVKEFTFWAGCKDVECQAAAKDIFHSIRFK